MSKMEVSAERLNPALGSVSGVIDIGSFTVDFINRPVLTGHDFDRRMVKINAGHRAIADCHGDNIPKSFFRLVNLMEKKRRGLRFIPRQVTKQALRRMRSIQSVKEFRL